MKIIYQKATVEDVETLATMENKLQNMLNLNDSNEIDEFLNIFIAESIIENTYVYYIAKYNEEIVGSICIDYGNSLIAGELEFNAAISFIFVDEKFRNGDRQK